MGRVLACLPSPLHTQVGELADAAAAVPNVQARLALPATAGGVAETGREGLFAIDEGGAEYLVGAYLIWRDPKVGAVQAEQ